ncbi:MAG TPA: hypothetical protein PKD85_01295 [Saprospiraceae bacterium]|nr:hypothetical protein [Saprospiraceae bacterium]
MEDTGVQTKVLTEKPKRFETVDAEIVIPLLDECTLKVKAVRELVKANLGNLVFRRVKTAIAVPNNYIHTTITTPLENGDVENKCYGEGEIVTFAPEEYKRNVAEHYKDFSVFTTNAKIRKENDQINGEIYGHSKNYADFDITNFEFYPVARTMKPREGDLVCGAVDFDKKGFAHYAYWFVCSEQFLRFWTLVMFDQHDSFHKVLDKTSPNKNKKIDEEALRRKVLSGNHLMTCGYRKWLLSCDQTLVDGKKIWSTYEELKERFWLHRTEAASMHVHIYTALILLLRYNELPCEYNVPNNINNGPFMKEWDLPEGWINAFCASNGLYPQYYTKIVKQQVMDKNPPKGTFIVGTDAEEPSDDVTEDEDVFIPQQIEYEEE